MLRKKFRRLLTGILAVAMVVAYCPMALADETGSGDKLESVTASQKKNTVILPGKEYKDSDILNMLNISGKMSDDSDADLSKAEVSIPTTGDESTAAPTVIDNKVTFCQNADLPISVKLGDVTTKSSVSITVSTPNKDASIQPVSDSSRAMKGQFIMPLSDDQQAEIGNNFTVSFDYYVPEGQIMHNFGVYGTNGTIGGAKGSDLFIIQGKATIDSGVGTMDCQMTQTSDNWQVWTGAGYLWATAPAPSRNVWHKITMVYGQDKNSSDVDRNIIAVYVDGKKPTWTTTRGETGVLNGNLNRPDATQTTQVTAIGPFGTSQWRSPYLRSDTTFDESYGGIDWGSAYYDNFSVTANNEAVASCNFDGKADGIIVSWQNSHLNTGYPVTSTPIFNYDVYKTSLASITATQKADTVILPGKEYKNSDILAMLDVSGKKEDGSDVDLSSAVITIPTTGDEDTAAPTVIDNKVTFYKNADLPISVKLGDVTTKSSAAITLSTPQKDASIQTLPDSSRAIRGQFMLPLNEDQQAEIGNDFTISFDYYVPEDQIMQNYGVYGTNGTFGGAKGSDLFIIQGRATIDSGVGTMDCKMTQTSNNWEAWTGAGYFWASALAPSKGVWHKIDLVYGKSTGSSGTKSTIAVYVDGEKLKWTTGRGEQAVIDGNLVRTKTDAITAIGPFGKRVKCSPYLNSKAIFNTGTATGTGFGGTDWGNAYYDNMSVTADNETVASCNFNGKADGITTSWLTQHINNDADVTAAPLFNYDVYKEDAPAVALASVTATQKANTVILPGKEYAANDILAMLDINGKMSDDSDADLSNAAITIPTTGDESTTAPTVIDNKVTFCQNADLPISVKLGDVTTKSSVSITVSTPNKDASIQPVSDSSRAMKGQFIMPLSEDHQAEIGNNFTVSFDYYVPEGQIMHNFGVYGTNGIIGGAKGSDLFIIQGKATIDSGVGTMDCKMTQTSDNWQVWTGAGYLWATAPAPSRNVWHKITMVYGQDKNSSDVDRNTIAVYVDGKKPTWTTTRGETGVLNGNLNRPDATQTTQVTAIGPFGTSQWRSPYLRSDTTFDESYGGIDWGSAYYDNFSVITETKTIASCDCNGTADGITVSWQNDHLNNGYPVTSTPIFNYDVYKDDAPAVALESISVKVKDGVTIEKDKAYAFDSLTDIFDISGKMSDGTDADMTNDSWNFDKVDSNVAVIDNKAGTVSFKKNGSVIVGYTLDDVTQEDTVDIIVETPTTATLESISVNVKDNITIEKDKAYALTDIFHITAKMSDGTDADLSKGTLSTSAATDVATYADGKIIFKKSGDVTVSFKLDDVTKENTVAVTVSSTPSVKHTLTIRINNNNGERLTKYIKGKYSEGEKISISAKAKNSKYRFVKWESSNGGEFARKNFRTTTFTMPANDAVITAFFKNVSSGNSHSRNYFTSHADHSPAESLIPIIKGDSKKAGWKTIINEIKKSKNNSQIIINMNGKMKVPSSLIAALKGKNVTVIFEGKDYRWLLNGKSIAFLADVDLTLKKNKNSIPLNTIKKIAGENKFMRFSIEHYGEFGFTGILEMNLGKENMGKQANLYYYTPNGKLVPVSSSKIFADGNTKLTFTHASDYAIVISDKPIKDNNQNNKPGATIPTHTKNPPTGDNNISMFTIILIGTAAMAILVKRKKDIK